MKISTLLGTAFALVVALAVSLPGTALAADSKSPVDPGLKKAIDNARFYVPSVPGVVHFHNGSYEKHETIKGLGPNPWVEHGTTGSYIDDIYVNTSKPHVWHAPDALLVVSSSGTFTGVTQFTDVIAVRYVHGKIIRAAHHKVFGFVQNVEFSGRSVKITYLTPRENEALCCPTLRTQMTLQYTGAPELKEVPTR